MSFEEIAQREAMALRTANEMYHAFHGAPLPTQKVEEEDEQRTSGESGGAESEESEGGNRARRAR